MAFYDHSHIVPAGRLRRVGATLVAEFFAWREACATRKALSKLTDSELNDIGLLRDDLDHMSDFGRLR